MFGPKQDPYESSVFTDQDEQPQASYPEMPEPDLKECLCITSGGMKECSYHANQWERKFQRMDRIETRRELRRFCGW